MSTATVRTRTEMPPIWPCRNDPPCPHSAVLHDVADGDDRAPRCCVDDCECPASSYARAVGARVSVETEALEGVER